ncbi:MAG: carbohydrate ABC transporter permease [Candidatus Nanopelagicales bacterium]
MYPLVFSLLAALNDSSLGKPFARWTGLKNLRDVVGDEDVLGALVRTTTYALLVTITSVAIGLIIALALDRAVRMGSLIRTILLLPLLTPAVTVAILWKVMLAPSGGLVSTVLTDAGLDGSALSPLSSTALALPTIALADVWEWTPLVTILLFAALQTVDSETLEAATLDGADGWRLTTSVVLPSIAGALAAVALIRLVLAFKVFDLVAVLTSGGPGQSTTTASYLIYQRALQQFDVGQAAVITLLLAIVVTVVSLPFVYAVKRFQP